MAFALSHTLAPTSGAICPKTSGTLLLSLPSKANSRHFSSFQGANIFLLQETHWKTGTENVIRSQWGFEWVVAGPDCASKGVAVLFKNNFEYKIHNILKDDEGRYVLIDIEMLNKRLTLANVYAPSSGDHSEFFDTMTNEVVSMDNELIVIGGDWNVALNPKFDSNQPSSVYCARSRRTKKIL